MSENDKIVDKIKKLLALGNHNDNSFESERAITAAMKLAAGIGMTISEIGEANEPEKRTVEESEICANRTMQ